MVRLGFEGMGGLWMMGTLSVTLAEEIFTNQFISGLLFKGGVKDEENDICIQVLTIQMHLA